jgi:hypothetical protein
MEKLPVRDVDLILTKHVKGVISQLLCEEII